jgi:hypothetical protein
VEGAVNAARCPIHEERLVRSEGTVLLQPSDTFVRQVVGEVIGLIVRWFDGGGVLYKARLPL